MAQVRLKVNMIIDGLNYPYGTIMEEDDIPPSLRRPEYYAEKGEYFEEPIMDEIETEQQTGDEGEVEEEEVRRTPAPPKVKIRRRLKPLPS